MDDKTKQQKVNQNGQLAWEYGFGLAIPKAEFGPIWQAMQTEAMKFINPPPPFGSPQFAYKIIDGDSMDKGNIQRGIAPKPYSAREGYGGCFVINIKSQLDNPPPVFRWNPATNSWQQADPNNIDGNKLKTGDYVQVGLALDAHLGQSPGLYVNPQGIQFVGFGTAIMRGPDAATMFGAGPAALPPGATAIPQAAPASAAPPVMPTMPAAAPLAAAGLPGMPQVPSAPNAAPSGVAPAVGLPAPALPTASPSSLPGMPAAPVPPATGFVAAAAGLPGMPAAAPPAPAIPAAPAPTAAPVHVGYDPTTGKPIWQMPDGSRVLGQ